MMSSVVQAPSIFLLWHPVRIILISKSECGSKKATHWYHTFIPSTKRRKNAELLSSSPECLSDSFPSYSVGKYLLIWLAFEWGWNYCYASQSQLSRSELHINITVDDVYMYVHVSVWELGFTCGSQRTVLAVSPWFPFCLRWSLLCLPSYIRTVGPLTSISSLTSVSHLCRSPGILDMCCGIWPYVISRDPNSGFHNYVENVLRSDNHIHA